MKHETPTGWWVFAILAWLVVAVALVLQNALARGPYIQIEKTPHEIWRGEILRWGWPWSFAERIDAELIEAVSFGNVTHTTKSSLPLWKWNDSRSLAVAADACFAVMLLVSTAFVLNYWRREEKRSLQFGLRAALVATAIIAVLLSLLSQNVIGWMTLLYAPLAFAMICLPSAIAIVFSKAAKRKQKP